MRHEEFFEAAVKCARDAADQAGAVERSFELGSWTMRVRFAGEALVRHFTRAMMHLETAPGENALRIECFDSASTGTKMPPPPWTSDAYLAREAIAGWERGPHRARYDRDRSLLQMQDTARGRGLYWTKDWKLVPWWEQTFPFRQTIHWWAAGKELQPVHAGAVGFADGGVLVAGRSGSGKSTSTLSCLQSELLYAGDDYVLLDLEQEQPWVRSLYSTAKLVPENLERLPWLEDWVVNRDRLAEQKAVVYVNERAPGKVSKGFPIRAILLPRVTGRKSSSLVPGTAADALAALAPTTLFHLNGDAPAVMRKLSGFVRRAPVYWLDAGTELQEIPLRIGELLGALRG